VTEEFYKRHRPKEFSDVLGQAGAVKILQSVVKKGITPHAILFSGPSGVGKTTLARILAGKLGASDWDTQEINSASFRGIDTPRDIAKAMVMAPVGGKCRAWILDEFHQTSSQAQEAFLKILEDTPKHVYFMICTTSPGKLISAVKTRTTEIKLSPVPEKELTDLVKKVAKAEGVKLTQDVLEKLVENSEGSARKALVSLEEISHLNNEEEQLNYLGNVTTESQANKLFECFFKKKPWPEFAKVLQTCDQEPEGIRQMLLAGAKTMLVGKGGKPPSNHALGYKMILAFGDPIYDAKTAGQAKLAACCYEVVFGE
jgi:DNA polymerase III gamma/tau subunit